jgi:hypothetical protein
LAASSRACSLQALRNRPWKSVKSLFTSLVSSSWIEKWILQDWQTSPGEKWHQTLDPFPVLSLSLAFAWIIIHYLFVCLQCWESDSGSWSY